MPGSADWERHPTCGSGGSPSLLRPSLGFWYTQGRLLLLRTSAIFCELTLTRGGCRDFRRGDGSERAVGRHDTSSNRLRFFAGLTIRIAYARICA